MKPRLALVKTRDSVICAFLVRQDKKIVELAAGFNYELEIFPVTITIRRKDIIRIEIL